MSMGGIGGGTIAAAEVRHLLIPSSPSCGFALFMFPPRAGERGTYSKRR